MAHEKAGNGSNLRMTLGDTRFAGYRRLDLSAGLRAFDEVWECRRIRLAKQTALIHVMSMIVYVDGGFRKTISLCRKILILCF